MFPIYILDGKTELPKKGTFYVIAQDGIYLQKETGLINALVKVEKISFLQKLTAKAELNLPKIPSEILVAPLLFFRRVYERHNSEAGLLLYYSHEKNIYEIHASAQEVSHASVDYEIQGRYEKEGLSLVGTIHSHCDFNAFHSGIDVHDERDLDGIHITIGRVDQPYFTISSTIAVNNNRFEVNPEDLIFGLRKVEFTPKPKVDYKRLFGVKQDSFYYDDYRDVSWFSREFDNYLNNRPKTYYYKEPKKQFYDLTLPEGKDYRNYPYPKAWLEKVRKKIYKAPGTQDKTISGDAGSLRTNSEQRLASKWLGGDR
jgi:PRTRC genetic system protein A